MGNKNQFSLISQGYLHKTYAPVAFFLQILLLCSVPCPLGESASSFLPKALQLARLVTIPYCTVWEQ